MKAIKILIHLKIATLEDIYTSSGDVIENKIIFMRSMITQKFEGPYYLDPPEDLIEITNQLSNEMIYVIDDDESSDLQFNLIIREARPDDIKATPKELRIGMRYYINIKNTIQGPYFLTSYSKKLQLKKDLLNKNLFIVAKKQKFEFINIKKTA